MILLERHRSVVRAAVATGLPKPRKVLLWERGAWHVFMLVGSSYFGPLPLDPDG